MLQIFAILNGNQAVRDMLHDGTRLRAWGFGYASEEEVGAGPSVKPYCVWQIPSDVPELGLSCDPLSAVIYQFDVYGRDGNELAQINSALQYALSLYGKITMVRHPVFETDGTKLYRAGFDLSYIDLKG